MVDQESLYRKAIVCYGFPAQAAMMVEECSELMLSANLEEVELMRTIL
jgi:hypothetical protein